MSLTHTNSNSAPTIAVVGSGPSGCFAAQFLRKQWPDAEITIFDAMPVPYGLIRYGIAPDHQGNKAVSRQFDRLFERQNVRFVGGVEIGKDVSYTELADDFDIVVLATGMEADKPLDVPCSQAATVTGAGAIMRALNGDPTVPRHLLRPVGRRVGVIGNGNVSLDVVRMLVAPAAHFVGSDVDDDVLDELRKTPVERVDVIGRSPAKRAKFDLAGLREICRIPGVAIRTAGLDPECESEFAQMLRQAEADVAQDVCAVVCFRFDSTPTRVDAVGDATSISIQRPGQDGESLVVDTLITAIGFVPRSDRPDQEVVVDRPNVFLTGWRRRGATGGVAANRKCAQEVVAAVVEAFGQGLLGATKPGARAVVDRFGHKVVDFDGWRRIDAFELESARAGRCRTKAAHLETMFTLGRGGVVATKS